MTAPTDEEVKAAYAWADLHLEAESVVLARHARSLEARLEVYQGHEITRKGCAIIAQELEKAEARVAELTAAKKAQWDEFAAWRSVTSRAHKDKVVELEAELARRDAE